MKNRRDEVLRDINAIREKRREVIATGNSFNISGGISQNQQTLKELAEEERRLLRVLRGLEGRGEHRRIDYVYG